ncbi:MAG: hypothetical protein HFE83_07630 [Lachnospiraceae bacterium]|nr:hypothetical protein [Lachnospiraceae bacterium]
MKKPKKVLAAFGLAASPPRPHFRPLPNRNMTKPQVNGGGRNLTGHIQNPNRMLPVPSWPFLCALTAITTASQRATILMRMAISIPAQHSKQILGLPDLC